MSDQKSLFDAPQAYEPTGEQEFLRKTQELDERMAIKKGWVCGRCLNARRWMTSNDHDTGFINCTELARPEQHRSPTLICAYTPSRFRLARKELERFKQSR
jgi:hypothetical protein